MHLRSSLFGVLDLCLCYRHFPHIEHVSSELAVSLPIFAFLGQQQQHIIVSM
jgi:hypothetical protein